MLVDTIEHESGIVAKIHHDEDPQYADPRGDTQLGIMYCWHPNYVLGDEQFTQSDHSSIEAVYKYLVRERKATVVIPLFLLDHSGISIQTGTPIEKLTPESVRAADRFIGDSAGWDTSWVGFIFTNEEKRKEVGAPRAHTELIRQLEAEVEEYDLYLRGEVYGYVIEDADGDNVDSCWGFLGYEYIEAEAKEAIECAVAAHEREKSERQFWLEREVVTVG